MKMNIQKPFGRALGRAALILPLLAAALTPFADVSAAAKTPFSRIVVFGDSLSDTGNFFGLTGNPPPPYADGRFSNGPVWSEYLAEAMGMALGPDDTYAVGGATSGRDNINDIPGLVEFPGLLDQIDLYELDLQGQGADPEALHIVWAGGNDFLLMLATGGSPEAVIANGVSNNIQAVQRLRSLGAQHIMVVGLPDLGLTPMARAAGLGPQLTYLSNLYNGAMTGALDQLAALGAPTSRLDIAAFMSRLIADPAGHGLDEVEDAFLSVGGNPDGFMFWDAIHPTTVTHSLLAEDALESLIEFYSPAGAQSNGRGARHQLNGRVNAVSRN
jgi:phospholipase/lecithinase/hemolysin